MAFFGEQSFVLWLLLIAAAVWLLATFMGNLAHREPSRHDFAGKLGVVGLRLYSRFFHRTRFDGLMHLREADKHRKAGRPIILIANHVGGVDALLIQGACPFFIRWIMADDMRLPWVEPILRVGHVLFVGLGGRDLSGLRSSLEHLKAGWSDEAGEAAMLQGRAHVPARANSPAPTGVIGLFPEGRIARKPGVISPFQPGAGLIISRSGALVLPVTVQDIPLYDYAYWSLITPSRARITFHEPVDYFAAGAAPIKPANIVADLESRFAAMLSARVLRPDELAKPCSK
jgi:1-acyl-sn-glycerol-3-phosphate acyltransferase